MFRTIGFLVLFFFISTSASTAQQRFKAGPVVGLNVSQIDGDLYAGYNKLGLEAGIRVAAVLTPKTDLSFEILFSQRGSQSELFNNNAIFPFKMTLNHVAVPIQYNYKDWLYEEEGEESYYKVNIAAGITLARLISTSIEDDISNPLSPLVPFFKENELAINLGGTFYATQHIAFGVRWTRSLTLLFERTSNTPNSRSLVGKFITFRTLYIF